MAIQVIAIGQHPNDGTGDPIRTAMKKINENFAELSGNVNHWRGDWDGVDALPATGGTFTGGVPGAGDEWRLTQALSIGGKNYAPGTIIKAMVNTPGQDLINWSFIAVQL